MIGRLLGSVAAVDGTVLLVDVHGVGYEVEVTTVTLNALDLSGGPVELFTHLVVRDDAHALFGFASAVERDLFRALIKVNSVGPKLAMALLSSLPPAEFARCISEQDVHMLTRVPGVGKRTAERLLMELKDRMDDLPFMAGPVRVLRDRAAEEAVSALVALGWRTGQARKVVDAVRVEGEPTEALIRAALKRMASRENGI